MSSPIQYKVFHGASEHSLEEKMNKWLDELFGDDSFVFDIRETNVAPTGGGGLFAVVLYEKLEVANEVSD